MAYYGVGDGWCFSSGGFAGHVKVKFINGAGLEPVPPVTPVGMGKSTQGVELKSVGELDEHLIAAWMRQVASRPGIGPRSVDLAAGRRGKHSPEAGITHERNRHYARMTRDLGVGIKTRHPTLTGWGVTMVTP